MVLTSRMFGWDPQGDNTISQEGGKGGALRLFLVLGLADMMTEILSHHPWVSEHWPGFKTGWTGFAQFIGMALILVVWRLVRVVRRRHVEAIARGERSHFLPLTVAQRRWGAVFGAALGAAFGIWLSRTTFPRELIFLSFVPWLLILSVESSSALRESTRLNLKAREEALRAKLAPHFIFNTLNTLHAQIEADPTAAQATTEKLAQLFRQVLEVSDLPTIPLKQELAFVEAYLGIEQARMGGRLTVRIEVPEELENVPVPPLSLQVLVENAIKHGVAPLERGGEVVIGAMGTLRSAEIYVEDPGTGLSEQRGTGTALETLRLRLEKPEDLRMGMVLGRHRVGFVWREK